MATIAGSVPDSSSPADAFKSYKQRPSRYCRRPHKSQIQGIMPHPVGGLDVHMRLPMHGQPPEHPCYANTNFAVKKSGGLKAMKSLCEKCFS